jgi:Transmembrane domain of unknown function (DUF3566)
MSMARTVQAIPASRERAPVRRTRVVIRRVGPWSLFRFSLLFYFCIMVVIWLGLLILYQILGLVGVLRSATDLLNDFWTGFRFHGWWIFSRLFAAGLVMVVFGAVVNLFVAFLYNLISDFVGGVEVTLAERR